MRFRWPHLYCVLAGACDTSTGALLILTPDWTLRLMGIPDGPVQTVYLGFLGAFVGSVGLLYFYPFSHGLSPRTDSLLETVLRLTAVVRVVVGLFVTASILRNALAVQWGSVALTDLTLAAVQVAMVRREVLQHAY